MKGWRKWIAAAVAGLALALATATPAHAWDYCKDAPPPMPPVSGMAGLFTLQPATPATGDPFTDARIPVADVYGYAWGWSLYDLGCTPNALADPGAVFNTKSAELIMQFGGANLAILGMMEFLAKETGLGWMGDWTGVVAASLQPLILGGATPEGYRFGLLPISVAVMGVWLIGQSGRASYSLVARSLGLLVVCTMMTSFVMVAPGYASRSMDGLVQKTAAVAGSAFSASLTDGANRQAMYRAWLAGQFGDPDSALAIEYGPKVLTATRYTWAEWRAVQADLAYREKLDNEKAKDYKAIAAEIKEKSPSTYLMFQGRGDRQGPALFGVFSAGLMSLFALIAYFMILISKLIMQLLIVAAPIVAFIGLLPPRGANALKHMWHLFAAAMLATFKFTLAAGLMTGFLGLLATLPGPLALLLMTLATVAALWVLKPVKAFKSAMPGLDPDRNYTKELAGLGAKLAGALITGGVSGAVAGGVAAAAIQEEQQGPGQSTAAPQGQPAPGTLPRVELHAPEAPPPTRWAPVPGTHRHVPVEPPSEHPALPAGPGRWEGVLPSPPEPLALPPGKPATPPIPQTQLTIEGPTVVLPDPGPAAPASQVILEGEVLPMDRSGTYQRPSARRDIVDAEIIEPVPLAPVESLPDRGTDQPAHELVLYQSHKAS